MSPVAYINYTDAASGVVVAKLTGETIMTLTMYTAKVTEIIDAEFQGRGGFDYPENFESDCEVYFGQRLSAKDAAAKIMASHGRRCKPETVA